MMSVSGQLTRTFSVRWRTSHFTFRPIRTMSTTKDVTLQSDITKLKSEPDGSFKRSASSFRNVIEKGGKFEAEQGEVIPTLFTARSRSLADRYHLYVSYACRMCYSVLRNIDTYTGGYGSMGYPNTHHAQIEGLGGSHP